MFPKEGVQRHERSYKKNHSLVQTETGQPSTKTYVNTPSVLSSLTTAEMSGSKQQLNKFIILPCIVQHLSREE